MNKWLEKYQNGGAVPKEDKLISLPKDPNLLVENSLRIAYANKKGLDNTQLSGFEAQDISDNSWRQNRDSYYSEFRQNWLNTGNNNKLSQTSPEYVSMIEEMKDSWYKQNQRPINDIVLDYRQNGPKNPAKKIGDNIDFKGNALADTHAKQKPILHNLQHGGKVTKKELKEILEQNQKRRAEEKKPKVLDTTGFIPRTKEEVARIKAIEEANELSKIIDDREIARDLADKNPLNSWDPRISLNPKNITRENLATVAQGLESQFRFSDAPNFFDDYLNPLNMIGNMASNLGQAPLRAQQEDSVLPYITSVGTPVVAGALGSIGANNTKQFVNNVINPLAGSKDIINDTKNILKKTTNNNNSLEVAKILDNLQIDDTQRFRIKNLEELKQKHKQEFVEKFGPRYEEKDLGLFAKQKEIDNLKLYPTESIFQAEYDDFIKRNNISREYTPAEELLTDAYTQGYDKYFNNRGNTREVFNNNFYDTVRPKFEELILKNKLQEPTSLFRGTDEYILPSVIRNGEEIKDVPFTQLQVGDEYAPNSFVSTSLLPARGSGFGQYLSEIKAPAKQSLLFPNATGVRNFENEIEAILPHKLRFKVDEVGPNFTPYKTLDDVPKDYVHKDYMKKPVYVKTDEGLFHVMDKKDSNIPEELFQEITVDGKKVTAVKLPDNSINSAINNINAERQYLHSQQPKYKKSIVNPYIMFPGMFGAGTVGNMFSQETNNEEFKNGGWLSKYYQGSIEEEEITPQYQKGGTVYYGTKEYEQAYKDGTFKDKANLLDEVVVTAHKPTGKNILNDYPYYNELSEQEKQYFNDYSSPIGSAVRRKAQTKTGLAEDAKMIAPQLLQGAFSAMQVPQSAMVEGIEALRGNDYNLSDAWIGNNQRVPSDAWGYENPQGFWQNAANIGMDVVADPANITGAGFMKQSLKGGTKKLVKNFKSEIDWAKWNKEIPENSQLIQEYNAIEQASKANGTWMKNPDGSAFKGTPEQFVQQNSENFKKAFPNIFRDEVGNIQKTYHGSPRSFDVFDPNFQKRGTFGKGIYTSLSKDEGKFYTKNFDHIDDYNPSLVELYQNVENPISPDDFIYNQQMVAKKKYEDVLFEKGAWGKAADDAFEQYQKELDNIENLVHSDEFTKRNRRAGNIIVVPYTNYPKSAIGNNGMFDMNNPNIYQGIDGNFMTRPLTPFTKNELSPGNHLYRKIGNKKGLQDLIDKGGAQAPAPMRMNSGQVIDTPFFGYGKRPNENYSGLFAVEHAPESLSKYNWTNRAGGTNNYGVAPVNPETGELIKNIPLEDLEVYRKKWFSNNYRKLDKNNLKAGMRGANTQNALEKTWKWGSRGVLADQIFNDGEFTGGKYIEMINKKENKENKENGGWLDKYQQGGVIEDDRGQWAHPGKITKINSNNITMQGVNYPVLGISDTGDTKLMQPGKDYNFEGNSVTEYPQFQTGGTVRKKTITVNSKNDPRYVAYKDSLTLYNHSKDDVKILENSKDYEEWNKYVSNYDNPKFDAAYNRLRKLNKEEPNYAFEKSRTFETGKTGDAGKWKKPIQPVILEEREKAKTTNNLNPVSITPKQEEPFANIPDPIEPMYYQITENTNKNIGSSKKSYKTTNKAEVERIKRKNEYDKQSVTGQDNTINIQPIFTPGQTNKKFRSGGMLQNKNKSTNFTNNTTNWLDKYIS